MSDNEQMMPLNLISSDININLEMINELDLTKPVTFQLTNCSASNEVIELLLTHSALKSLQDVSRQSRSSIESKREEIISLLNNSDLFSTKQEIPSNDYIEWSLTSVNLMMKHHKFREQIALYNSYDVRHPLITMQIVEIIQYYIKEYLVREENFSSNYINKLEECFQDAIRQQNYFIYFIKAYTMSGNFHHVLNKHLSLYIIDYFDPSTFIFQPGKYRLINCLAHITGLSLNYPHIHQYRFKGMTYRGLMIDSRDLKFYTIGNYILNRSFVSTSKDRSVANMFSGFEQEHDSTNVSVLFKYKIGSNTTGLDIERISSIEDEQEVIILPFSVFQIKDKREIYSKKSSQILHEIHLEEYHSDQIQDRLSTNHQQLRNQCKAIFKSKYFYTFIGLCILISLLTASGFIIKSNLTNNNDNLQEQITSYSPPQLKSNTKWKQQATTIAGSNMLGNELNELAYPKGIYIDYQQKSIYIADVGNDRIVKLKLGENKGQVVAGGNGPGSRLDQLTTPTMMIVDQKNKYLIISDYGNRRVVQWSLENQQDRRILIENIDCAGLMMNENGDLFVSDDKTDEVKRWRKGEKEGTIVAGGNGRGDQLHQLNNPTFIFIDRHNTMYVSDWGNSRVMKWMNDSREGTVVAGGHGYGNGLEQLSRPNGLIVNEIGDVYVIDSNNCRIMCWPLASKQGLIIIGEKGQGNYSDQLNVPIGLTFDRENNLYVVDHRNHRVQRFSVDKD